MTREEAIDALSSEKEVYIINIDGKPTICYSAKHIRATEMAIEALEQETRKDEVILSNKEYRELLSNEYENGYAKGYREALEQEPILDKIRADIANLADEDVYCDYKHGFNFGLMRAAQIIDKYRKEHV